MRWINGVTKWKCLIEAGLGVFYMMPKLCGLNVYMLLLVEYCMFCYHVYNSAFYIFKGIQYLIYQMV